MLHVLRFVGEHSYIAWRVTCYVLFCYMLRFVLLHVTFCFISLCFTVVLVTVLLIKCLAGTYGSNKNSEINAKNMGLVEKVKLKNIKYIVDAEWVRYTTSNQTDTPIFFLTTRHRSAAHDTLFRAAFYVV